MIGRIDAADQPTGLVARIMAPCEVGQPTVSHHLRVLREAGIVTSERRGQWIFYRLAPHTADPLGAIARSLVPGGLISVSHLVARHRPDDALRPALTAGG